MTTTTTTTPVRYRMPVVFGPAPGPRQKADGTPWKLEETGTMRQQWLTLEYLAVAEQLNAILPPGFSLRGEPTVKVVLGNFSNLYWLAGRSYGILNVLIPVTYRGRTETVDGDFMPVIWEGLADAIITGRDELGFPKLVADLPDLDIDESAGTASGSASWLNHLFFEMQVSGLREELDTVPAPQAPTLTFKYVPRTSVNGSGGADIASVTTGLAEPGTTPSGFAPTSYRSWTGTGDFQWHRPTFAQQPTTFHIINGLADLDVVELRGASLVEVVVPGLAIAGPGQRTIEPAAAIPFVQFPVSASLTDQLQPA